MSTRRGVGLSAFQNRSSVSSSYATHGASLRNSHSQSIQTQLSVFQSQLHAFALQHADDIKSNPAFRAEFARMCNALGVDPLAASVGNVVKGKEKGNERGWWALLKNRSAGGGSGSGSSGGSGSGGSSGGGSSGGEGQHEDDLHLRLAMRVVEICRAGRSINGGLLGVEDCREMVKKGQGIGGEVEVTDDDILRAVESLKPLGSGFSIVTVGSKKMIRSIPKELSTDQSTVLEAIQMLGYITATMLEDNLTWEHERGETVLQDLLADSLVWVDSQAEEKEYWAPPTDTGED